MLQKKLFFCEKMLRPAVPIGTTSRVVRGASGCRPCAIPAVVRALFGCRPCAIPLSSVCHSSVVRVSSVSSTTKNPPSSGGLLAGSSFVFSSLTFHLFFFCNKRDANKTPFPLLTLRSFVYLLIFIFPPSAVPRNHQFFSCTTSGKAISAVSVAYDPCLRPSTSVSTTRIGLSLSLP